MSDAQARRTEDRRMTGQRRVDQRALARRDASEAGNSPSNPLDGSLVPRGSVPRFRFPLPPDFVLAK